MKILSMSYFGSKGQLHSVWNNCWQCLYLVTLSVLPPTQARQLLQDYQEAIADFQEVQKIEPNNKAAKTQIVMSRNQLKRRRDQEKRRFANMFDKFAAEDERWVHLGICSSH